MPYAPHAPHAQEATDSPSREIDQVLCQVREELMAMATGTVTIHVGPNHIIVETNRKLPEVKRTPKPIIQARKGWG